MWNSALESDRNGSGGIGEAGLIHEIGNQLLMLNGYSEILYDQLCVSGAQKDWVRMARMQMEAGQRIMDLVRYAKDAARSWECPVHEVDVQEVVFSVCMKCQQMLKSERIRISQRSDGKAAVILGNVGRLEQVLLNLVINSCHALEGVKPEKWIIIETRKASSKVLITVSDNGCGMPAENLGRIFEPFFTTKPLGKGSGIGLSIAKQIVKSWKGEIDAVSEEGKGTIVSMVFPCMSVV